jgi:transcriptional regulator with XRE-family HTH domain
MIRKEQQDYLKTRSEKRGDSKTFSGFVKNARLDKQLTIKTASKGIGISYQYLWQIETNIQQASYDIVNCIGKYYGLDQRELAKLRVKESIGYKEYLQYIKTLK